MSKQPTNKTQGANSGMGFLLLLIVIACVVGICLGVIADRYLHPKQ